MNNNANKQDMLNDDEVAIDLMAIWQMLVRRRMTIAVITMVALIIAILYVIIQPSKYTAAAVLQFNLSGKQVVDIESVVSGLSSDALALESEIDIIKSRILLGRVIDKLNLVSNKEFEIADLNDSVISNIKYLFGFGNESKEHKNAVKLLHRNIVIDKMLKQLTVVRKSKSYTVNISFISKSQETSMEIVNMIVDEYLVDQLNARFSATKVANDWLNDRVKSLSQKVKNSELAVQTFRQKYDLIGVGSESEFGSNNLLSEMNSQLIIARTARAQAESRLQQAKASVATPEGQDTIAEVLNSKLINDLKVIEAGILKKKSEYNTRYGARHPLIINVNAELEEIKSNLERELVKIIQGMKHNVESARIKEESIEQNIARLREKALVSNSNEMQLFTLIREMEANQALYESFLSRFKETSADYSFYQNDVRVLSYAQLPRFASWPKKKLIFILALILGCGFGVVVVIIIEYFDNAFRSSQQIEKTLSVPAIGMVCEVKSTSRAIDYAIERISSAYAESLRAVNLAVHFSNPDSPPKSIVVTSSVPREGKSVFAASISRLLAKSGAKVLLVDCDLRLPTVHTSFDSNLEKGLDNYLMDNATLKEIIGVDKDSGLHYVRSFPDTPHSQELLGSHKMEEFLKLAKEKYDMVILDAPPIMALSDAIVLSHVTDATILLARWEKTPRNIVKESIKRLSTSNVNIAGVVLSRVDIEKQSKYNYNDAGCYYGKYTDYYKS